MKESEGPSPLRFRDHLPETTARRHALRRQDNCQADAILAEALEQLASLAATEIEESGGKIFRVQERTPASCAEAGFQQCGTGGVRDKAGAPRALDDRAIGELRDEKRFQRISHCGAPSVSTIPGEPRRARIAPQLMGAVGSHRMDGRLLPCLVSR